MSSSSRAPTRPLTFADRSTSVSTARSVLTSTRPVERVLLQPQPTEPVHRVGDVDQQRAGHRVAAVGEQGVDDLLGVVAGGPGVPQPQRSQSVGVDVLGGALQLGEGRDGHPARVGVRMIDLEQQGLVGLDHRGVQTSGS